MVKSLPKPVEQRRGIPPCSSFKGLCAVSILSFRVWWRSSGEPLESLDLDLKVEVCCLLVCLTEAQSRRSVRYTFEGLLSDDGTKEEFLCGAC
jgi:hypothetical protein